MKRFLVVGCGGAGGLTLQFLMDQLRADLMSRGITTIPRGWQFVHLDVPVTEDGIGPGIPPTVARNGGRYVHVSSQAATYPEIARVVEDGLAQNQALDVLATWRPDPARVNIPVDKGAGQFRAVGRMLTLSQLERVRTGLEEAWRDLQATEARQQVRMVASRISPATVDEDDAQPVVLVVSSMAGGSGASMALDVCRLLGTINGAPRDALLFLYTAEVFYRLEADKRAGVEANAMAMIGELIAAQAGTGAGGDRKAFRALGKDIGPGNDTPFRRVIPIGAKIGGDGAVFGDGSSVGVFRGVGRGLAALMLSGVAMGSFQKSTSENFAGTPLRQANLGWGVDPDRLLWGSFGFAAVGMGRDRYAEYAAQRLARLSVDRLLDGHRDPRDDTPAEEQIRRRTATEWPGFAARVGVPTDGTRAAVEPWLNQLFERNGSTPKCLNLVQETIGRRAAGQGDATVQEWVQLLTGAAHDFASDISRRIDEDSYAWAFGWQRRVDRAVQDRLREVVSLYGLATGRRLLDHVAVLTEGWVAELNAAHRSAPDLTSGIAEVESHFGSVKGRVPFSGGQVRALMDRIGSNARSIQYSAMAGYLARMLVSMRSDFIEPLQVTISNGMVVLERRRSERSGEQGQALLRTLEYQAWPAGGRVPSRFGQAHNEIFLTPSDGYEQTFQSHVSAGADEAPIASALDELVRAVVTGTWPTTGGDLVDDQMFDVVSPWWPGVLRKDLDNPNRPDLTERRGGYTLTLTNQSLLDRARLYVARPNGPFHEFVSQSLRGYLTESRAAPTELMDRAAHLERAFQQALELSRPLAALNPQTVQHVHARQVTTYHSFTEVPFGEHDVANRVRELLGQEGIDSGTVDAFEKAVESGQTSDTTRVDIFGRYPYLSPVVYTSLLEPLARTWQAAGTHQRSVFWQWRRSRRLPGGLPVGEEDRLAMIAGYFLGRAFGLVEAPTTGRSKVFDLGAPHSSGRGVGAWVDFPDPLLSPFMALVDPLDKLASLLESMVVALAACHNRPELDPLQPYAALRRIFDDGDRPAADAMRTSGAALIADWIQQGRAPGGTGGAHPLARSALGAVTDATERFLPDPEGLGGPTDKPARRKELLADRLKLWHDGIATDYVPGGSQEGAWSTIGSVNLLPSVPMFHEIAEDAVRVLSTLERIVQDTPVDADTPSSGPLPGLD